jgi:hypothetical protein
MSVPRIQVEIPSNRIVNLLKGEAEELNYGRSVIDKNVDAAWLARAL